MIRQPSISPTTITMMTSKLARLLPLGLGFSILAGCVLPTAVQVSNTAVEVVPPSDPSKTVCDPLGNGSSPTPVQGLYGKLYYLAPDQTQYGDVEDYISHGLQVDADLYFSQLNVPTRLFNLGFVTQD